jgi:chemotaxis protein CheX
MLGIDAAQVNGEVPDAIAEVANMIAGQFRNSMVGRGDSWAISVPSVTVGTEITTKFQLEVAFVHCSFEVDGSAFFVELALRESPA